VYELGSCGKAVKLASLLRQHPEVDADVHKGIYLHEGRYGRRALSLCLSRGHIDCARLLVEHKEDVHAKNRYGGFVLLIAIKGRDFNLVELGEEEMLCALDST
jgi:hypothetical protein